MGGKSKVVRRLATIWHVPDQWWERIGLVIRALDPPASTGRPRADARRILDGVIFRLRTGCQWNKLPEEFGDDSTIHRTFQRWLKRGLLDAVWADVRRVRGTGRARLAMASPADTAMGKALRGGEAVDPKRTDRARTGVKRSILVEAESGPLGAAAAPANVHDRRLLEQAIVVQRPEPTEQQPQNLCLDKGYDNPTGEQAVEENGYVGHIGRIGAQKPDQHGSRRQPPRRWVVERTLGWLNRCRAILVRYEKKACNYLGLIKLACVLLWYSQFHNLAVLI